MTVATQLRLAIGALIAALVAILAAAFYVPHELNESANEKYVEDAIPLRGLVQDLVLRMTEQEAAVEAYLVTQDQSRLARYDAAVTDVNVDLREIRPHLPRHPRMNVLVRRATGQIADLQGLFQRMIETAGRPQPEGVLQERVARVDEAFERFRRTALLMNQETAAFVQRAEQEQSDNYRQLLIILAVLGSISLAIGAALFVGVPRRLGTLYEAEQRSREEAESRADAARALVHVSDGVILTDDEGAVRYWNPAAEELTEVAASAAFGRRFSTILPTWDGLIRQADEPGGAGGAAVLPLQVSRGERWLSVTSVDFGEGVVYALRDVTEERALETMRSDFVSTASHELRTPMTSIAGAGRTLLRLDDELSHDRRRAFLEMIVTESDRLSRIVDQILLASRLDAGRVEVASEECDAVEITRSVIESARMRLPEDVELTVDAPEELNRVECDPDRLRQVLVNIIDNAIKYSPDGGTVRVELAEVGDMMRFAVRDEGIGFSPSASESIFERFHRLDPQLTRGIGGTGLGLYICRELVERMGGRIWADSRPGAGSSFFFELPLAREAVAALGA
jgi:signal transduction histidine kinase